MLFGVKQKKKKVGLMGIMDAVGADWLFGSQDEEIELDPIDVSGGGSSTGEQSTGWFDWLTGGGTNSDPCATGASPPGSICYSQGWRERGDGTNIKVGSNVPNNAPSTPTDWSATVSNAIGAITAGFWPKPAGGAGPTTTPVTPVVVAPTPWYQSTGGKLAIAAAVVGGAYYVVKGRKKS